MTLEQALRALQRGQGTAISRGDGPAVRLARTLGERAFYPHVVDVRPGEVRAFVPNDLERTARDWQVDGGEQLEEQHEQRERRVNRKAAQR